MRIAVVSTTTYSAPPLSYGGEVFYWHLARGLCELGHDVTLYGAPGSKLPHNNCRCRLKYFPGTYGRIDVGREHDGATWYYHEILANDLVVDCSHNHFIAETAGWYHRGQDDQKILVVLNGVTSNTPRCGPYNTVVGSEFWKKLLLMGRTQFFGTSFADAMGISLVAIPPKHFAGVIHWATDTNFYVPSPTKDDYFLWLSRPTAYKGLSDALEIAAWHKLHLKIVPGLGNAAHEEEFKSFEKGITLANNAGARIEVVTLPLDSTHHQKKRELYQKAKALLYPIKSHEPFGLTVIEALSCGTPVLTYDMGAMPEILQPGVTGYICENLNEMIESIEEVSKLSPEACRADAEKRWHYTRAAKEYAALIE